MNRTASVESEPGAHAASSEVVFAAFARTATRRYVIPPLILSLGGCRSRCGEHPAAGDVDGRGEWCGASPSDRSLSRKRVQPGHRRRVSDVSGLRPLAAARHSRRPQPPAVNGPGRQAPRFLAGLPCRAAASATAGAVLCGPDGPAGDPHDLADRYSLQRQRYAELGLLPLRFTVWVLPLLGFIGTVVGIARSITGLEAVIAPGAGGQATEGLLIVLGGLQFAFDTTLLGLVTVIPVMLLQMVLGGRESQVTEEVHHRVLALLTMPGAAGASSSTDQDAGPAVSPPPSDARDGR